MRKTIIAVTFALFSAAAVADYQWSEAGEINYLGINPQDQFVRFGINEQVHMGGTVCTGRFYALDMSSSNNLGKEMYSFLLAHKATQEKIQVYWENGCDSYGNPLVSFLQTPK